MKKWIKDEGIIYAVGGEFSQSVCALTSDTDANEMEASAYLIAAAPDMLEALELIVKHFENEDESARCMDNNVLHHALCVIEKAKGEEV